MHHRCSMEHPRIGKKEEVKQAAEWEKEGSGKKPRH
jgi:hypothetical protein